MGRPYADPPTPPAWNPAVGLVDEWRLYVVPVVLGAGRPLFPPGTRLDLDLIAERRFGNGVVELRYR
ncbi:dihydrofolate reductase family protein [Micromonospora chersina]